MVLDNVCTNPDMYILRSPPGGVVVGKEFYKPQPLVLSAHILQVIQIKDVQRENEGSVTCPNKIPGV